MPTPKIQDRRSALVVMLTALWLALFCCAACAGVIVLSGDDGEDHCQGMRCGNLYALLLRAAADSSRIDSDTLLAVGVNGSTARTALESWNLVTNGGPGLRIRYAVSIAEISSLPLERYRVVWIPTRAGETGGGITQLQLDALATRAQDVQSYLNGHGGSLLAMTLTGFVDPYAWLPLPLSVVDQSVVTVTPTEDLVRIAPGATSANISHSEWHSQFTGPPGYLGMKVLARAAGTGLPVLIGSEMARVVDGPVCTLSPASGVEVAPGDTTWVVVSAAAPTGATISVEALERPRFVSPTPALPFSGPASGTNVILQLAPRANDSGDHFAVFRATGADARSSAACTLRVHVPEHGALMRALPSSLTATRLPGEDSLATRLVNISGLSPVSQLEVSATASWLRADLLSQSDVAAILRVTFLPHGLGEGEREALVIVNDRQTARTASVSVGMSTLPAIALSSCVLSSVVTVTPQGSVPFDVRLVRADGSPVAGVRGVWLDLSGVTGVSGCEGTPRDPIVEPLDASDDDGRLTFFVKGVGCPRGRAVLRTQDGQSREVRIVGLDTNGDGRVAMSDFSVSGCGDVTGDGAVDREDWQVFRTHVGESCRRSLTPLRVDVALDHFPKVIHAGDTVTVSGSVTNLAGSAVRVDSLSLTAKGYGIGRGWVPIGKQPKFVLLPGETKTVRTLFVYPLDNRHTCFRATAYTNPAPQADGPSGAPFWRIADDDSVSWAQIGLGSLVVAALPFDPGTGLANWEEVRLFGHRLVDASALPRSARELQLGVFGSTQGDTLFYLWKQGLLHVNRTAREDTLVSQLAYYLAQLRFAASNAQATTATVAAGSVPEPAPGHSEAECRLPGCVPCHPNGCGPDPLRGDAAYWQNLGGNLLMPQFRQCCNSHDCCYHGVPGVGGTASGCDPRRDRRRCDDNWLACMVTTCAFLPPPLSISCAGEAFAAYGFVSGFYEDKFNNDCRRPPKHLVPGEQSRQLNTQAAAPRNSTTTPPSNRASAQLGSDQAGAVEVVVPVLVDEGQEWRVETQAFLPPGVSVRVNGQPVGAGITVKDSVGISVEIEGEDAWASGEGGSLMLVAFDAEGEYVGDAEVLLSAEGTVALPAAGAKFVMGPNPTRQDCVIGFASRRGSPFEVVVYGIDGRVVRRLASGPGMDAWMQVRWNGRDSSGKPVAPGMFYVRLRNGGETLTRALTIIR